MRYFALNGARGSFHVHPIDPWPPDRFAGLVGFGRRRGPTSVQHRNERIDARPTRGFLDLDVTAAAPDHSTLSRTRRRVDVETHEAVFTWILERLSAAGLVRGKTVGIDATTLEANAAMRSIARRDTGEIARSVHSAVGGSVGCGDTDAGGTGSVRPVAEEQEDVEQGVEIAAGPGREDLAKMKDGRTHLAHKVEHGVRHGHGSPRLGDRAGCIGRRYGDAAGDADHGGRAGGVGAAGRCGG